MKNQCKLVNGIMIAAVLAFSACDGGGGRGNSADENAVAVTGVSMKSSTQLFVGGAEQLVTEIMPPDATDQNVTWSTSDYGVASVNQDGLLSGKGPGTATVIVTTEDGGFTAGCMVTVIQPVTGVFLKPNTALFVGGTEQLVPDIEPPNASNKNVTWSTTERIVADVNKEGLVTGRAPGTATVIVTTEDGGFTAGCVVTVTQPVTGVILKTSTALLVGGTEQLVPDIEPSNASNKNVTWSTQDEGIASVSPGGLVTGESAGSAAVTVTTEDGGFTASCAVTVSVVPVPVAGISLDRSSAVLDTGETVLLVASIEPADATDQNVAWSTSDCGVASVNQGGMVAGEAAGSAVVTVTSEDGGYEASCNIDVYNMFITTWNTGLTGEGTSASNQVKLPLHPAGVKDFYVEWGDGNTDHITSHDQAETTHSYPAAAVYDVVIYGTIEGFGFSANANEDKIKLLDVKKWGDVGLHNGGYQFSGAVNLSGFSAVDAPYLGNISNMRCMFMNATEFDGYLASWDVRSVTDMSYLFSGAGSFNQDISSWDVGEVTTMYHMFAGAAAFNGKIGSWDVSRVACMKGMFYNASSFNRDLDSWDVSAVTDMSYLFFNASAFNGNIDHWDVGCVRYMNAMFYGDAVFDRDIGAWDVGSVENMSQMFHGARAFSRDIGSWDVGSVTNLYQIFSGAVSFNQDIGAWDVSAATDMSYMFCSASSFNQDIGSWDVGSAANMKYMFYYAAAFNRDIGSWDVGDVTDMSHMFQGARVFNRDIGSWDVGSVDDMSYMFYAAAEFSQDLDDWDVGTSTLMDFMFDGSALEGDEPDWYHE
ncbi:MAG TPA: BspA family leucine-rich repeat surface protein [Spirochaetota bacterium]|nr:BspA family leucine-rich repeat surface protein [Spirochaetota bacterium]HPR46944.1 BspA family leucine-rich repeat surface protein [Spirochaetota bacterium]